jgi:AraC-like DNA-binding protein
MKENLASMLMTCIFRTAASNLSSQSGEKLGSHENRRIRRAEEFLRENFTSEFSLAEVSAIAEISPFYFIKLFKLQTGKTPYEFVLDIKIDRAKELLTEKGKNITEVCISCGFNNPSHFSSIFKRKTGVSPTEYRRRLHLNT